MVVVKPFQHHMSPEHQKAVEVLVDAFEQKWPISRDFELLPTWFPLSGVQDGQILIYRRIRKSTPAIAGDTYERISKFVRGS